MPSKSKDPAFLFYPNDYIGGTMGMTFEEKGAYMELLMMQFNTGHMGGHMCGQLVGQLWDKLKHKFVQDENGLWYNERLDEEKSKRKAFTDSRKNNLEGKNQHNKKGGHKKGHMTSHMENENENVILPFLLQYVTWHEKIAASHGVALASIPDHIKRFWKHVESQDKANGMTKKEATSWFDNWLRINKSKPSERTPDGKPTWVA